MTYQKWKKEFLDKYIDDNAGLILEQKPLRRASQDGQMAAFKHQGFWHPMDTLRDKNTLEKMWESGKAPWKVWWKDDNLRLFNLCSTLIYAADKQYLSRMN